MSFEITPLQGNPTELNGDLEAPASHVREEEVIPVVKTAIKSIVDILGEYLSVSCQGNINPAAGETGDVVQIYITSINPPIAPTEPPTESTPTTEPPKTEETPAPPSPERESAPEPAPEPVQETPENTPPTPAPESPENPSENPPVVTEPTSETPPTEPAPGVVETPVVEPPAVIPPESEVSPPVTSEEGVSPVPES